MRTLLTMALAGAALAVPLNVASAAGPTPALKAPVPARQPGRPNPGGPQLSHQAGGPPPWARALANRGDSDQNGAGKTPPDGPQGQARGRSKRAQVKVRPASVSGGSSVVVRWKDVSSADATDWFGLYQPGDPSGSSLLWRYMSCTQTAGAAQSDGSCTIATPDVAGTYEVRLFASGSQNVVATSDPFTVTAPVTPQFQVRPNQTSPGGAVTITWAGIPNASATDWVGLYQPGASDVSPIDWFYVDCQVLASAPVSDGTCSYRMPLTAGTYEFRLFWNGSSTRLATSPAVSVIAPPLALSVQPSSAPAGNSVTFAWSNIPNPQPTDWFGLYQAGASDTAPAVWEYVNCSQSATKAVASGSCTVGTPEIAGAYEFRLFSSGGLTHIGGSTAVALTAPVAPQFTATPSNVAAGSAVTASWSGIVTPNVDDWFGLYHPGDLDPSPISWSYVNCTQTATVAEASGSCQVTIPSAGTYELRLFASGSLSRLAVSGAITAS